MIGHDSCGKESFLNQLSLLSIINQNKHVVYHTVYTAHAQNAHVVSIVITRLAISYRDSNETIAIFTLSILSPRPRAGLFFQADILLLYRVVGGPGGTLYYQIIISINKLINKWIMNNNSNTSSSSID